MLKNTVAVRIKYLEREREREREVGLLEKSFVGQHNICVQEFIFLVRESAFSLCLHRLALPYMNERVASFEETTFLRRLRYKAT